MSLHRNTLDPSNFNQDIELPYSLRLEDFKVAVQDVYDFFYDVNKGLTAKGLERLDDMLRPAIMSGVLSDMLTASLAKHSRALTVNTYFNGHPDLVVRGEYPDNAIKSGLHGIEIKTTRKGGGAVDTHGAREQWSAYLSTRLTMKPSRHATGCQWHLPKFTSARSKSMTSERMLAANLAPVPPRFIRRALPN